MMSSIKVTQPATLPAGVKLRLVDAQAKTRVQRLKALGKGLYEVLEPVQFKAGEILDLELSSLPKALRDAFTVLPRTVAA